MSVSPKLGPNRSVYSRRRERQWAPGEWNDVRERLESLTIVQLRKVTKEVGIEFEGGTDRITDKEELVRVLDEADKEDLSKSYEAITGLKLLGHRGANQAPDH